MWITGDSPLPDTGKCTGRSRTDHSAELCAVCWARVVANAESDPTELHTADGMKSLEKAARSSNNRAKRLPLRLTFGSVHLESEVLSMKARIKATPVG